LSLGETIFFRQMTCPEEDYWPKSENIQVTDQEENKNSTVFMGKNGNGPRYFDKTSPIKTAPDDLSKQKIGFPLVDLMFIANSWTIQVRYIF
jgi:hypothetical protein